MGLIIDILIVILLVILVICELKFTSTLIKIEKRLTDREVNWWDFKMLKNQVEVISKMIFEFDKRLKEKREREREEEKEEKTERNDWTITPMI